jgi:putative NADH-flavin reductase
MKITVFGATGPAGLLIVEKALAAGHHVTALARTPGKITLEHPELVVNRGDVLDPAQVASAVEGRDAVVSCLGSTTIRPPITVYSAGARNMLTAMKRGGVRRMVVVSSGGLNPRIDWHAPLFFELILKPIVFRYPYADMRAMEKLIMDSDTEWTLLRPPRLLDGPETGATREAVGEFAVPGKHTLTRADLATTVLRKLSDRDSIRQAIAVAGA